MNKIDVTKVNGMILIEINGLPLFGPSFHDFENRKIVILQSKKKIKSYYDQICYWFHMYIRPLKRDRQSELEYIRNNRQKVNSIKRKSNKKHGKKQYQTNKDNILKRQKIYYNKNSDIINEKSKKYVTKNLQKTQKYQKEYRQLNADELRQYGRNYRKQKRTELNQKKQKRKKTDIVYAFSQSLRKNIASSFKRIGKKKSLKSQHILGCDFQSFKLFIELQFKEGMNWQNYGNSVYDQFGNILIRRWQLDHRIPLGIISRKEYKDISEEDKKEWIQKLCYYLNYQPMWQDQNIKKGDKLNFKGK